MYVKLGWIGCAGVMVDVVDAIAQNEAENALVPKLAFFYLVIIPSSVGSERRRSVSKKQVNGFFNTQ